MEEKKETKLHVIEQDGKFGFADESGNVVIPCVWDAAHEFSEGRAAVLKRHARWGYIDMQGELVIKCGYESACDFKDGIARVNFDFDSDSEFYIDKNENIIEFVFRDQEGTKSKVRVKARMLAEQGKYDEAIECLKPEAGHEEITTKVREDLVHYLYEAKRYDEVIQWCKVTLEEWMNAPNRLDPESNLFSDYEWVAWKLAEMYEKGLGVEQNMLEAVIYYDIIVWETGDDDATNKVKEILEKYPQLREELEVQRSHIRSQANTGLK